MLIAVEKPTTKVIKTCDGANKQTSWHNKKPVINLQIITRRISHPTATRCADVSIKFFRELEFFSTRKISLLLRRHNMLLSPKVSNYWPNLEKFLSQSIHKYVLWLEMKKKTLTTCRVDGLRWIYQHFCPFGL